MGKVSGSFFVLLCVGYACLGTALDDALSPESPPRVVAEASAPAQTQRVPPRVSVPPTVEPSEEPLSEPAPLAESKGPRRDVKRLSAAVTFDSDPPDATDYAQFHLAAEKGDPNSQYSLAFHHCNETGDMNETVRWLRAAALQNHAKAQTALAHCYRFGSGIPEDREEAISWYQRASDLGNPRAQCELAEMYMQGEGGEENHAKAVEFYRKAAGQGYSPAQFSLGEMYATGEGVEPNAVEAAIWFRKAAEQGHWLAQCGLGPIYYYGNGVDKDYAEAAKWFRKAAKGGSSAAQFALGVMYAIGEGLPQDANEALSWYSKAAEKGHVHAQVKLAQMYASGSGVPRQEEEAAKWYIKAAIQGHTDAQVILGLRYTTGRGIRQDYGEAARWLTKAAEQGDEGAQYWLAKIYYAGQGVLEDYSEAYKWIALASMDSPRTRVQQFKETLRSAMTPDQIEEGLCRARAFLAERPADYLGGLCTLQFSLSKDRCAVGEPVVMTVKCILKVHAKDAVFNIPVFKSDDFQIEDEPEPIGAWAKERVTIDGVSVTVTEDRETTGGLEAAIISFRKVLLPRRPGHFVLPPVEIDTDVAIFISDPSDPNTLRYEHLHMTSNDVELHVLPKQ